MHRITISSCTFSAEKLIDRAKNHTNSEFSRSSELKGFRFGIIYDWMSAIGLVLIPIHLIELEGFFEGFV